MATTSLAKQVADLRKLIEAGRPAATVYLQAGSELPEGLDESRVIRVERVYIDPPEQPEELEIVDATPAIERACPPSFNRKLAEPNLGIV